MVVRFRKKVVKRRGSRTYGYGSSKKHRGKGSKGGKGLAGSGKKGQHKKIKLMLEGYTIGKRGFKTPLAKYKEKEAITTRALLENIEDIVQIYDGTIDSKNKTITLSFGKNVKIIYQKSFEGMYDKYKEYRIELSVHHITDKAKDYLEKNGVVVKEIDLES